MYNYYTDDLRHRERDRDRQRQRQTETDREREEGSQAGIYTCRQTGRHTDRQADTQTGRRQANREGEQMQGEGWTDSQESLKRRGTDSHWYSVCCQTHSLHWYSVCYQTHSLRRACTCFESSLSSIAREQERLTADVASESFVPQRDACFRASLDILDVNEQHFAAEDMSYGVLTAETGLTLSTRKQTRRHKQTCRARRMNVRHSHAQSVSANVSTWR